MRPLAWLPAALIVPCLGALGASLALGCTVEPEDGPLGQPGGEPAGGSVSCEGVCAHLEKVCNEMPAGCDATCGKWSEEVRGCVSDATECAQANACPSNPNAS